MTQEHPNTLSQQHCRTAHSHKQTPSHIRGTHTITLSHRHISSQLSTRSQTHCHSSITTPAVTTHPHTNAYTQNHSRTRPFATPITGWLSHNTKRLETDAQAIPATLPPRHSGHPHLDRRCGSRSRIWLPGPSPDFGFARPAGAGPRSSTDSALPTRGPQIARTNGNEAALGTRWLWEM